MVPSRFSPRSRAHPFPPGLVLLAGLGVALAGSVVLGAGLMVGALLAYGNSWLLSRRVDIAADTGNIAGALMVMQAGLLVTLTVVGIVTFILIRIAPSAVVGGAIGFAAAQTLSLIYFFIVAGRNRPAEGETL
jgi:hypothetical protein